MCFTEFMSNSMPTETTPLEINPSAGTLIIEPYEESNNFMTVSENMSKKDNAGVVLAIGPDTLGDYNGLPMRLSNVKIGSVVYFRDFNTTAFHIGSKFIKFVKFIDILGVKNGD